MPPDNLSKRCKSLLPRKYECAHAKQHKLGKENCVIHSSDDVTKEKIGGRSRPSLEPPCNILSNLQALDESILDGNVPL